MLNRILNYINGALGQPKSHDDFDGLAPEDEEWPDNGIVCMPGLGSLNGTVCELQICTGDAIQGGQLLMSVEAEKCIVEVPSPCSGYISEILADLNSYPQRRCCRDGLPSRGVIHFHQYYATIRLPESRQLFSFYYHLFNLLSSVKDDSGPPELPIIPSGQHTILYNPGAAL